MMTLYGIKNCDSVQKAKKLLTTNREIFHFQDFRQEPVDEEKIQKWLDNGIAIEQLFNTRGTTYRKLKLKELELSDEEKVQWLAKENMLIKRPVIVLEDGTTLVGYQEDQINSISK